MIDQPLTPANNSKITLFLVLLLPTIFLLVGILPALFLVGGYFAMRMHQDFNYMMTAVKAVKAYIVLPLLGSMIFLAVFLGLGLEDYEVVAFTLVLVLLPSALYLIAVDLLLYKPLLSHWEWIEANGIFSSKATINDQPRKP